MFDTAASDPASNFSGLKVEAVAAYGNGRTIRPNFEQARSSFPHVPMLEIDVMNAGIGNAGDFENGDMQYSEAGSWSRGRIAKGVHRPVVYFSVSAWPAIRQSLASAGVSRSDVRLWTAHYSGRAHLCSSVCGLTGTTADATQWCDPATAPPEYRNKDIDVSMTADDFFSAPTHSHHPHEHHEHEHHEHAHHEHVHPQHQHPQHQHTHAHPTAAPQWTGRLLRLGSTGPDVREWQDQMRRRGFADITADGTFDARAAEGCRWLQLYLGRPPTEEVDAALWEATWSAP